MVDTIESDTVLDLEPGTFINVVIDVSVDSTLVESVYTLTF